MNECSCMSRGADLSQEEYQTGVQQCSQWANKSKFSLSRFCSSAWHVPGQTYPIHFIPRCPGIKWAYFKESCYQSGKRNIHGTCDKYFYAQYLSYPVSPTGRGASGEAKIH